MSTPNEFDRRLSAWLNEAASAPVPAGRFEQAVATTRAVGPRPRWLATLGSEWTGSRSRGAAWAAPAVPRGLVLVALLALLAVALIGVAVVGGQLLRSQAPQWRAGALAYDLDGDVYFADAGGANARRVLDGVPAWVDGDRSDGPTYGFVGWAPDGRHVLFLKDIGARSQQPAPPVAVLVADADGRIVSTIPDIWVDATWSPDSTRIAAWVGDTIGIFGTDGNQQASLRLPDAYVRWRESGGAWAPDGRSVSVQTDGGYWQLPIDGSAPRRLADEDPLVQFDLSASLSRDGRRMAGISSGALIVANADGTDRRVLGGELASSPTWSPTGTQLAYIRTVAVGSQATRDELRVIDISSGHDRVVASLPGEQVGMGSSLIEWSPGGAEVMVSLVNPSGKSDLYSVDLSTGVWSPLAVGALTGGWQWIADQDPT